MDRGLPMAPAQLPGVQVTAPVVTAVRTREAGRRIRNRTGLRFMRMSAFNHLLVTISRCHKTYL